MLAGADPPFVLAGSPVGWGADLEDAFDLIVFLTTPTEVRLARLRQREPHAEEFYAWAAEYDDGGLDVRSRARHEQWLAERTCPILRLDGTESVEENLRRVLDGFG